MLNYFPTAGYLRVQLLQTVFARLTDLESLWPILDNILTLDEAKEVPLLHSDNHHNKLKIGFIYVSLFLCLY